MTCFYRALTTLCGTARAAFGWYLWCAAVVGLNLGVSLAMLAKQGPGSFAGWVALAFGLLYLWLVPGVFRHWRRLDWLERMDRIHRRG